MTAVKNINFGMNTIKYKINNNLVILLYIPHQQHF